MDYISMKRKFINYNLKRC